MSKIRRFKKEDWYAFAGAEKFSNGSEPFIYEVELNDGAVGVTIIADANGIEIYMSGDPDNDDCEYYAWLWEKKLLAMKAEGEMRAMIREFDLEENPYAADVSYAIDHNHKWKFDFDEV